MLNWREAVYGLRTALLQAERGPGSLQFTSFGPGEGKSFVLQALAGSLAEVGRSTLLVDAQLRRPWLTEHFGLSGEPGLFDLDEEAAACWRRPVEGGFCFLGLGRQRELDEHLLMLGGRGMRARLSDLTRHFEFVLLESPSLNEGSDALQLGLLTGGTYIVAATDRFSGIPEAHLCEDLLDEGVNLLGLVRNDPPPRSGLARKSWFRKRESR